MNVASDLYTSFSLSIHLVFVNPHTHTRQTNIFFFDDKTHIYIYYYFTCFIHENVVGEYSFIHSFFFACK